MIDDTVFGTILNHHIVRMRLFVDIYCQLRIRWKNTLKLRYSFWERIEISSFFFRFYTREKNCCQRYFQPFFEPFFEWFAFSNNLFSVLFFFSWKINDFLYREYSKSLSHEIDFSTEVAKKKLQLSVIKFLKMCQFSILKIMYWHLDCLQSAYCMLYFSYENHSYQKLFKIIINFL